MAKLQYSKGPTGVTVTSYTIALGCYRRRKRAQLGLARKVRFDHPSNRSTTDFTVGV